MEVTSNAMKGQSKKRKPPSFTRSIFAENVKAAMETRYMESTDKPMALAKDCGMTKSSIQRIIKGDVGPSVDSVESVASALGFHVFQLFIPNLDVKNPPILAGVDLQEKAAYQKWRRTNKLTPEPIPALVTLIEEEHPDRGNTSKTSKLGGVEKQRHRRNA